MYNNLHMVLRLKGFSQKELAAKVGLSERTMSFKIRGKAEFTLEEARRICDFLGISDPAEVVSLFQKD